MTVTEDTPHELTAVIARLRKDVRTAAKVLTDNEARYLVDTYYIMQENRKRCSNQVQALEKSGEPSLVIAWLMDQSGELEQRVKSLLDVYSMTKPIGVWAREQRGIGPVISAGLMAHIDMRRCPSVGHLWSFAGLNPEAVWTKGNKRPWNAALKTLCWKIGESFVKVCNHPEARYGRIYLERKEFEIRQNEKFAFRDQAEAGMKRVKKTTEAYKYYKQGLLPPGHIHARAKRFAVKRFLSHWFEVAYVDLHGTLPPTPYPIAHLEHVHWDKAV